MNDEPLRVPTGENHIVRGPGEYFWQEGATGVLPLRISEGVVAYRRGVVAVGLIGPGELALPIPGVVSLGPAAAELVAVTETVAHPVDPAETPLSEADLTTSALAVLIGADRLGNMNLPRRLAALLLDITEMTGVPTVGCRQEILAIAAAARRETVATILSDWRDRELIHTRYRKTRIVDRDALIRIRDGEE